MLDFIHKYDIKLFNYWSNILLLCLSSHHNTTYQKITTTRIHYYLLAITIFLWISQKLLSYCDKMLTNLLYNFIYLSFLVRFIAMWLFSFAYFCWWLYAYYLVIVFILILIICYIFYIKKLLASNQIIYIVPKISTLLVYLDFYYYLNVKMYYLWRYEIFCIIENYVLFLIWFSY